MLDHHLQAAVCFENALAIVREEPIGSYVLLDWKPATWNNRLARQACDQVLICLQARGWHKLLVSRVALPAFPTSYHTWLLYDWLPRAFRSGLFCYAVVLPREIFSRLAFEDLIVQSRHQHMACWMSGSTVEALAWLLQQSGRSM